MPSTIVSRLPRPVAILTGLLLLLLAACGTSDDQGAPTVTVTETVTATPSPTADVETVVESLDFDDVHAWLQDNVPASSPLAQFMVIDNNSDLDAAYRDICAAADGREPGAAFLDAFAEGFKGPELGINKAEAIAYVEFVVEGCRATGNAEVPWAFNEKDYKYPRLASAVFEAGFSDLLEGWADAEVDPSKDMQESCGAIDNEKPGSSSPVRDRKAWYEALGNYRERDRFVDVVFEACYATGNARRYVPPPPSFGEGTWRLGRDIPAGVYRTRVPGGSFGCYWERLRGFSGSFGDIITNGLGDAGAPLVVTIYSSDAGFRSQGCGRWVLQR